MNTPRVLAIDVGTSAIRAAVVDEAGAVLTEHRAPRRDGEAGLGFDADVLWRQVLATAAAAAGGHGRGVRGIGIAGHIGTVLVDRSLAPVRPGRGWADREGVPELRALLGPGRVAELLRDTGRPSLTGGALAALTRLRTAEPADYDRVGYALQPKDYLVARLTGAVGTDHTSAAYTGASAVHRRDWAGEVIAAAGLRPDLFPPQRRATDPVGTTTDAVTRQLGLPEPVPVVAGGPDGTVGAALVLGSRTDAIADVAGTTDVLVRVVERAGPAPAGAVLNPYLAGDLWTVGGATGLTGGAVAWWARLLGHPDPAEAIERLWPQLARIGPGAAGVAAGPSLSGSRFPRWQPADRGYLRGLEAGHGPAHVLLAVLESVAYSVREGVDTLAADEPEVSIVLAGGTARSARLAQLRADILGREVAVCTEPDVSLKGAALLALVGTGGTPLDEQARVLRGPLRRCPPDPDRTRRYDDLYHQWHASQGAA
ncbi:FGGY-family carbohydrate kinase [Plantactinospora sp. KBS50]|uniref:xylulokinase n=1 Tax=Plantactinospora sp. KBS50 TaxID=2024580 RepID=UPI0018E024DC|nr:FGGY-family carbohydrate kinase [Plantactinospora sp. KBS50]